MGKFTLWNLNAGARWEQKPYDYYSVKSDIVAAAIVEELVNEGWLPQDEKHFVTISNSFPDMSFASGGIDIMRYALYYKKNIVGKLSILLEQDAERVALIVAKIDGVSHTYAITNDTVYQ